jgi:hypothetical protein
MSQGDAKSHSFLRGLQRLIFDLQTPPAGVHPLTRGQEAIARAYSSGPSLAAWHQGVVLQVRGVLDLGALETALGHLQRRQAVLRSAVTAEDGSFRIAIAETCVVPLLHTNVESLAPELREDFEQRTIQDDFAWGFDLSVAPLWRVRLIRRSADDFLMIFVFHQLIADGASLEVVFSELSEHYAAVCSGSEPWLPPLQGSFAAFASRPEPTAAERQESPAWNYWQGITLSTPPQPVSAWGCKSPAGAVRQPGVCCSRYLGFPRAFSDELRPAALHASASIGAVVISGLALALRGILGIKEPMVATEAPGRPSELENELVGCFSNFLSLRLTPRDSLPFSKLVEQVGVRLTEAFTHTDVPFSALFPLAYGSCEAGRPGPRVLVTYLGRGWEMPDLGEASASVFEVRRGPGCFDLILDLREGSDGLAGWAAFDSAVVDPEQMELFLNGFRALLLYAAQNDHLSLAQLLSHTKPLAGPDLGQLPQAA